MKPENRHFDILASTRQVSKAWKCVLRGVWKRLFIIYFHIFGRFILLDRLIWDTFFFIMIDII